MPAFQDVAEVKAFMKRKELQGDGGINIKDEGHWVIFDADQVKSLDKNTGDITWENDDIRYSLADNEELTDPGRMKKGLQADTRAAMEMVAGDEKKNSSLL